MNNTTRRAAAVATTASTVVVRRGMGPLGWLTIIFVLLKLFGITAVANWSWWLVLLPLYGPFALVVGIWLGVIALGLVCVAGLGIIAGVAHVWESWKYRHRVKPRRYR